MNKILKNNVKALMSGVNEPLANAIKRLMTAGGGLGILHGIRVIFLMSKEIF